VTSPEGVRSAAKMRRENERLRTEAGRAAQLAAAEEVSAKAIAKAQWPQWAIAVFSAVITLAVASLGGFVALSGTHFGASEERARESRVKRAQIYADYLAAARTYELDYYRIRDLVFDMATAEKATHDREADELFKLIPKANAAGGDFFKQEDLVYVYGSDDAWDTATAVDTAITSVIAAKTDDELGQAGRKFALALGRFEAVFCKEASATPRNGCGS
jgi:hypothetical protein